MKELMIYGANGYSAEIILKEAIKNGLKPIVAGRNEKKILEVAKKYNLPHRVFSLDNKEQTIKSLTGISAVINCAGPFLNTFSPMVKACVDVGVDYLDISGELLIFEEAAARTEEFIKAGITVMPGVGFDIVPSDCLSVHLKNRLPDATKLKLSFNIFDHQLGRISRGTNATFMKYLGKGNLVRKNGSIITTTSGFDSYKENFNGKHLRVTGLPWGDISTAYHSTGIPNITAFMDLPLLSITTMKLSNLFPSFWQSSFMQSILAKIVLLMPEHPTEEMSNTCKSHIVGEVSNENNEVVRSMLEVPEVYRYTGICAIAVIKKLSTERKVGFQTAGILLGADFILGLEGTKRTDLN